jgi:hypothetical protein
MKATAACVGAVPAASAAGSRHPITSAPASNTAIPRWAREYRPCENTSRAKWSEDANAASTGVRRTIAEAMERWYDP